MTTRYDIALALADPNARPWEFPDPPQPSPQGSYLGNAVRALPGNISALGSRIGDLASLVRNDVAQSPLTYQSAPGGDEPLPKSTPHERAAARTVLAARPLGGRTEEQTASEYDPMVGAAELALSAVPVTKYGAKAAAIGGAALLGGATPAEAGAIDKALKFLTVRGPQKTDPGFVYHATNSDRARDIAEAGALRRHRPHEFTDQSVWPDQSVERRNYFTPTAENPWQFAPEDGNPVLLRAKRDQHPFKTERGTGDLYSTKDLPAQNLEALTETGWHPLSKDIIGGLAALGVPLGGVLGSTTEAEAGRIKGITHAISNTVLKHHPGEYKSTIEPTKQILERGIRPEDFEKGSLLTWLIGDRSASGGKLTKLGERTLDEPTKLQGGYQYIPEWEKHGVGWASTPGATASLDARVKPFLDEGRKVYGLYSAMNPQAVGGSKMATSTILNTMPEKLPRDALEEFNRQMQSAYPDMPSLGGKASSKKAFTPVSEQSIKELKEHLDSASITERRLFTDTMSKAPFQQAGFPDIAHVRTAVTHPDLLNAPSYQTGHAIAELKGGRTVAPELGPHADYASKLIGKNVGSFERSLPIGNAFPDFWKYVTKNYPPDQYFKLLQTGRKDLVPGQIVNQKWIDQASKAMERQKERMGDLAAQDYYR